MNHFSISNSGASGPSAITPSRRSTTYAHVLFFGRELADYEAFFGFKAEELKGRSVLDVAAGSASFTIEAIRRGVRATACDPCYALGLAGIRDRARTDFSITRKAVEAQSNGFNFQYHGSIESLFESRQRSQDRFLADYVAGVAAGRYREASLPGLPFEDSSFDHVFCGHFIPLYANHFDYRFHLESVLELCRVARDSVRIYPLKTTEFEHYGDLDRLRKDLERNRIDSEIQTTGGYSVLSDSNERLLLYPKELRKPEPPHRR